MPYDPLSDADIEHIALGLLDNTLPKPQWTHAGHFAAALWLLRHRPQIDLPREMPAIIRTYNEAVGGVNSGTEGYHETITQASLRGAAAFLDRYPPPQPLNRVLMDLMASPLGHPDWLLGHWSKSRLFSVEARRSWVEPDLQPLTF